MARYKLTDRQIRNAKQKAHPYKLADGDGLFLRVAPSGDHSWFLRYYIGGKEQRASLGRLISISLAEARTKADKARTLIANGVHLTEHKRVERTKRETARRSTFVKVSEDWIASRTKARAQRRWSDDYAEEVRASLRNHVPGLFKLSVATITAAIVAPMLSTVERKAPHMLEKVWRRLNGVLDYAVWKGLIPQNPLPQTRDQHTKVERKHFPAITEPAKLGEVLRAARASDPCKGIQRGHSLLAFTALRVSEVVGGRWDEFDLGKGNWLVPRERMKRKDAARGPHVIPLPPALLASLREWREIDGNDAIYVCPAPRDPEKPITAEAIEKHYRTVLSLGGKHSPHSWRSAFSTICREAGKEGDVIEAQLDHVVGNKVASAYDRARRVELRRELMKWYEATLLAAQDASEVSP